MSCVPAARISEHDRVVHNRAIEQSAGRWRTTRGSRKFTGGRAGGPPNPAELCGNRQNGTERCSLPHARRIARAPQPERKSFEFNDERPMPRRRRHRCVAMDGGTATAVRCTNQMAMLSARGRPWVVAALMIVSLFCALVCPTGAGTGALEDRLRGFSVGAHRGGFWSVSQSARSDFASSIANGADLLEIDLRWTKDGGVVVYHSDTLSKHTFCLGQVRDRTFDDVMHCRLLPTGARIESFEKLLRWTRGTNVVLDAEFKDDEVVGPALAL